MAWLRWVGGLFWQTSDDPRLRIVRTETAYALEGVRYLEAMHGLREQAQ